MNTADLSRLDSLDAPGSEALAQDTRTVRQLRADGVRYAGVHLSVGTTRLVSVSATRAEVDAQVGTAAYDVVTAGTRQRVAASEGTLLRFTLVWAQGRWKLSAVRDPGRASG